MTMSATEKSSKTMKILQNVMYGFIPDDSRWGGCMYLLFDHVSPERAGRLFPTKGFQDKKAIIGSA